MNRLPCDYMLITGLCLSDTGNQNNRRGIGFILLNGN